MMADLKILLSMRTMPWHSLRVKACYVIALFPAVVTAFVVSHGRGLKLLNHDDQRLHLATKNQWQENDQDLLHRRYHQERVPADVDYIIIGSGISGLWLAACLAKFNIKTVVLEQHYVAGGLQHTFTRSGYEFVPGLHYIANLPLCQPLYEMVADPNQQIVYNQAGNSVPADEGKLSSHDLRIGDLPVMHVQEGIENEGGIDKALSRRTRCNQ